MAVPSNTYQTYQQVGIREDLSDVIYNIDPTDTVLMSNFGKGKATGTLREWQTDDLAAASHVAVVDGDDVAASAASPTVRLGNYIQTTALVAQVSERAQAVSTAGRKNEMAYQMMKKSKEIKRNIETTLGGKQGGNAGNATTASESAGLATWMWDNVVGSATVASVSSGVPTTDVVDGAGAVFTETQLKSALEACWTAGGEPSLVVCGAFNKQTASGFTGIATQYKDNKVAPAAIIGSADIYVSDFGQVSIVASRFTPADLVYVINPKDYSVDYLQGIQQKELARTGLSSKRLIWADFTLRANNPKAGAVIGNTTTS